MRQELKLSQAKFAKQIAISNGYVAGLELGNRTVNDRMIKLICITFHVRESWLKTGEGDMFEKNADQILEKAIAGFQALKPAYQAYILKQIEQLLAIQEDETKNPPQNEMDL